MTIFSIGVVLAVAVVAAYLTLGARDFRRIRREVNGPEPLHEDDGSPIDPARETVGFAWRALGGVIVSVGLLEAISHLWWAWYLFPALALGTGVAVSVAFLIDPTRSSP